jgi:hypothetical protein
LLASDLPPKRFLIPENAILKTGSAASAFEGSWILGEEMRSG